MTARPCCRKVRCMARDDPRDASLIGAAGDLLTAFSDLVRKELRLAHAEVSQKLNQCLRAGIWMAAAVILGLLAALLVAEAAVFALASAGLALHCRVFSSRPSLRRSRRQLFTQAKSACLATFRPLEL
jgi:hypothetical protein